MPIPLDAPEVLEREFHRVRATLLEVAASLDRVTRAAGDVSDDLRLKQLRQALEMLASADGNRAEQFQMIFSEPLSENWQSDFDMAPPP